MHDMVMRLDDMGRPAWLALMVVSFVLFWPLGLAVLAFLLWSGRMGHGWGCGKHGERSRWQARFAEKWGRHGSGAWGEHRGGDAFRGGFGSSGNRAFDEYREATLKRLEDEQREFRDFLERLRLAKDRSEFDQFMADRKSRPSSGEENSGPEGPAPSPQT
ncbi:DUF2852 domain-containing protein [Hyphomicrobium sp. LHD-15]|uniref:DUF2852 domain-containing protein n=1 Tax=Hyphomicrobium sp. LHD-15 TaxID=3072142 RepID=UPI00280EC255|nr:DUF2852 domain-containing protein [Hyphomicrobium sp. LHD-15]MDQ8698175.1 DUF2852 domain-containing protein [Hyphomicrobium sp. LHD-15]